MSQQERIEELKGSVAALQVDLEHTRQELAQERAKFEEQISNIAAEQDKMNLARDTRINLMQTQLKEKDANIKELQELLEGKKAIKELQNKFNIQKSLSDKKQKQIDSLTAQNEKLKGEIDKLKSKLEDLSRKGVKELQNELKKKQAEVDELHLKIADIDGLQTEMLTEQKEIVTSFESQAGRTKELETINQELQAEIQRLSTGLDAQKLKAYDEFVLQLQNELNLVKNELQQSEQIRSEQEGSIGKFELMLNQIQSQISQQEAAAAVAPPPMQAPIPPQPTPTQAPQSYAPAQPQYQPIPPQAPAMAPQPTPQQPAQITPPVSGPKAQVIMLFDSILVKAQTGMTAPQLAAEMEQIRNQIVEIFEWHPTLFELAAFARRVKRGPANTPIDPTTLQSLIEKVEAWKQRILM